MKSSIVVEAIGSRAERRRFVDLPYRLHRKDPAWVAPLRRDVRWLLSRSKNPFFERGDAALFLAHRSGGRSARPRVVGRIAAIHNPVHNELHDERTGFFGFFECVEDQAVADALFRAAGAWLKDRGLDAMLGPTSFTINDECGLLVEGFDEPPTLLTPHNPSYYPALLEAAGFTRVKSLLQYRVLDPRVPDRLARSLDRVARRSNITIRSLDRAHYDREIDQIRRLFNLSWRDNWGFVPITEAEARSLGERLKPLVVPELVLFAMKGDRPVGFAVVLPDWNEALRANPSGRLFPGLVKVLWKARRMSRLRLLLLGLLEKYRTAGIDALLFQRIWEVGHAKGYRWCEAGWILEDNRAVANALGRLGLEHYKTLGLYRRPT